MTRSVSFDRAAGYYDETRPTDDRTLATILDLLDEEMFGRGPVLELGIGTGEIALPLVRRRDGIIGLDLSVAMMQVLVQKAGGRAPCPLIRGDATVLPFEDGCLGGVYARWVLHLIPDWMQVLRELDRAVVIGGRVAIEPGGFSGPFREMYLRYEELLGEVVTPVGLSAIDRDAELDAGFESTGWTLRREIRITYERTVTLREILDEVPGQRWSWTWRVPHEDLVAATKRVRVWAADRFGDLDRPLPPEPTAWRVYERTA